MGEKREWICLMVNGLFRHGDVTAVDREIASIFAGDLLEKRAVRSVEIKDSTGEYYLFVRCVNYHDHLERLRKSMAVVSVVPTYDAPHVFNDVEIRDFVASVEKPKRKRDLERGDMVQVTEGYLKNLFGVVEHSEGRDRYKVAFSFHLRRFSDTLSSSCLQFVANVLGREGEVSPLKSLEVDTIVKRDKLYRGTNRVREGGIKHGRRDCSAVLQRGTGQDVS